MLKFLLFAFLILLIIILLLIIWINYKRQVIQTFSIPYFIGSYESDDELKEKEKSFIETINDFFNDEADEGSDDGNGDIDDIGVDDGE